MLTHAKMEHVLGRIPALTVGVLGDLFLDRYLDLDGALTEPSLETGLDAYQVVRVRACPGAAGSVINNLAALGVRRIHPLAVIGDDGEGYELRQALRHLQAVEPDTLFSWKDRRTPTYIKPMLRTTVGSPRELNRFDIKNRTPLPAAAEDRVIASLTAVFQQVDALLVVDQVSEEDCGTVTTRVREALVRLAEENPTRFVLADSRARIDRFRSVCLKPNSGECLRAVNGVAESPAALAAAAHKLALCTGGMVFCTHGSQGISVAYPEAARRPRLVPAYPVGGPLDTVGAGDSTSAALACALAAGAIPEEAAAFGNLVASITIQQLGTTGTASPLQIRQRWREVNGEGKT